MLINPMFSLSLPVRGCNPPLPELPFTQLELIPPQLLVGFHCGFFVSLISDTFFSPSFVYHPLIWDNTHSTTFISNSSYDGLIYIQVSGIFGRGKRGFGGYRCCLSHNLGWSVWPVIRAQSSTACHHGNPCLGCVTQDVPDQVQNQCHRGAPFCAHLMAKSFCGNRLGDRQLWSPSLCTYLPFC